MNNYERIKQMSIDEMAEALRLMRSSYCGVNTYESELKSAISALKQIANGTLNEQEQKIILNKYKHCNYVYLNL